MSPTTDLLPDPILVAETTNHDHATTEITTEKTLDVGMRDDKYQKSEAGRDPRLLGGGKEASHATMTGVRTVARETEMETAIGFDIEIRIVKENGGHETGM